MKEFRTRIEETGRTAPDGRELCQMTLGFKLKSLTAEGAGTGYLSAFGNEDSYGDVVDPGAYTKTIADRSADNPLPMLWQHYSDEPIGVYTRLAEDDYGLYTEFKLAMGTQRGREAFELAQMKAVKGQSIGFTTIKDVIDGGVRRLKELKLWEGSLVTFPANELATVTGLKGAGDLAARLDKLAADVATLKAAIGQGRMPAEGDHSDEAAAVSALLAEIRRALPGEPRTTGEPDVSTRADRKAVAEMRREVSEYLAAQAA